MVKPRRRNGLDKRDELWCYILIKYINSVLSDPAELERLRRQKEREERISKSDLEAVVSELKKHLKNNSSSSTSHRSAEPTTTIESSRSYAHSEPSNPLLEMLMAGFREIHKKGEIFPERAEVQVS